MTEISLFSISYSDFNVAYVFDLWQYKVRENLVQSN